MTPRNFLDTCDILNEEFVSILPEDVFLNKGNYGLPNAPSTYWQIIDKQVIGNNNRAWAEIRVHYNGGIGAGWISEAEMASIDSMGLDAALVPSFARLFPVLEKMLNIARLKLEAADS